MFPTPRAFQKRIDVFIKKKESDRSQKKLPQDVLDEFSNNAIFVSSADTIPLRWTSWLSLDVSSIAKFASVDPKSALASPGFTTLFSISITWLSEFPEILVASFGAGSGGFDAGVNHSFSLFPKTSFDRISDP